MLSATMPARALALALALLVLFTQQFGVQHALSHGRGLGGTAGAAGVSAGVSAGTAGAVLVHATAPATSRWLATTAVAASQASADGPAQRNGEQPPAEVLCPVCLLLATLAAAALPAALRWHAAGQRRSAPLQRAHPAPTPQPAAHYRARAPPTLLALT